ncbi:MAG: Uma2 family endonuclease [Cyanobacteria bacterium J06634_6]
MVQTPVKTVTLEDFLQQPETKPASEYIDGQIMQKPMPKTAHSGIQAGLIKVIDPALNPNNIGRAFPELRCTFDNRSIVPDLVVLPGPKVPRDEKGKLADELFAAPDWMIEILLPGQSQTKVVRKIMYALAHGTQMGWLIDPDEECVFSYTPDLRTALHEASDAQLPVPEFAIAFQLTVGELVAWLYA